MLVCLFVSNKHKNGSTDWATILCGTSHMTPGKVYGKLKFQKLTFQQKLIFIQFFHTRNFFMKSENFFVFNLH